MRLHSDPGENRCRRSRGQSRTDQSCRCEDDRSFLWDRWHRTDPGWVQIFRTYRNTECKEPDSSEDPRRRKKSCIWSVLWKRKRYRDRCGSEIYWQECQCKPWKSRCDPYWEWAGKRWEIRADRAYQTLRCRGEEHDKRTKDPCIKNTSGTG